MRWTKVDNSDDVIDVRGAGRSGIPGGRVAVPGGIGLIGVIVILALQLLGGSSALYDVPSGLDGQAAEVQSAPLPATEDPDLTLKDFSVAVFTDVQAMWSELFSASSIAYQRAKLVLYSGAVRSGCGSASSAVGPFYCPADNRVYLDLSFQRQMRSELGADGDFAWAYVIAHEMGHHAQNQLGTDAQVRDLVARDPGKAGDLSVRQELQADCYAGVWAQRAYKAGALEPGDIDEALGAAAAVGDDTIQKKATGRIDPDSFTHGSSEQRSRWFNQGYSSGDADSCDTFSPDSV